MVDTITASIQTLMSQAAPSVADYMAQAVRLIDEEFGPGYAQKHPELVAAFISACAHDFHTGMTVSAMQRLADSTTCVSDSIDRVAHAIAGLDSL